MIRVGGLGLAQLKNGTKRSSRKRMPKIEHVGRNVMNVLGRMTKKALKPVRRLQTMPRLGFCRASRNGRHKTLHWAHACPNCQSLAAIESPGKLCSGAGKRFVSLSIGLEGKQVWFPFAAGT
jgi:hypothetical protein